MMVAVKSGPPYVPIYQKGEGLDGYGRLHALDIINYSWWRLDVLASWAVALLE